MTVTRRSFLGASLLAGAATTVGGGLLKAPLAVAKPKEPSGPVDPTLLRLLDEAPAYAEPGVPRGLQLSFSLDPADTRTVTWLTSRIDEGSIVQWGVVPANARHGSSKHLQFSVARRSVDTGLKPRG